MPETQIQYQLFSKYCLTIFFVGLYLANMLFFSWTWTAEIFSHFPDNAPIQLRAILRPATNAIPILLLGSVYFLIRARRRELVHSIVGELPRLEHRFLRSLLCCGLFFVDASFKTSHPNLFWSRFMLWLDYWLVRLWFEPPRPSQTPNNTMLCNNWS